MHPFIEAATGLYWLKVSDTSQFGKVEDLFLDIVSLDSGKTYEFLVMLGGKLLVNIHVDPWGDPTFTNQIGVLDLFENVWREAILTLVGDHDKGRE